MYIAYINWIISAYLIISVSLIQAHAQLQAFILELKRFSIYAKVISVIFKIDSACTVHDSYI